MTPPTAGEVRWCGRRIDEGRIEFLRDLAYLGHADGVKVELTVWEDLEVAQALRGGGLAAADALDRLGLTELCDTLGRYLSAGQRRRLALCRILASGARLWLSMSPSPRSTRPRSRPWGISWNHRPSAAGSPSGSCGEAHHSCMIDGQGMVARDARGH